LDGERGGKNIRCFSTILENMVLDIEGREEDIVLHEHVFIVKTVLEKGGGGENILTLVCNFEKSWFWTKSGEDTSMTLLAILDREVF
jgi:hypothetical protein